MRTTFDFTTKEVEEILKKEIDKSKFGSIDGLKIDCHPKLHTENTTPIFDGYQIVVSDTGV